MSKKRNKQHKPGERISVYLNKDLPPHFFEWLSKQDDVSAFVLYALERLYAETGNINVSNYLPRRFFFEDTAATRMDELPPRQVYIAPTPVVVQQEVAAVPPGSPPSLTDHIKFEETEIPQGNDTASAIPMGSIDKVEKDEGHDLHVNYDASVPAVEAEENPVAETQPETLKANTKWANLDHINVDDI